MVNQNYLKSFFSPLAVHLDLTSSFIILYFDEIKWHHNVVVTPGLGSNKLGPVTLRDFLAFHALRDKSFSSHRSTQKAQKAIRQSP